MLSESLHRRLAALGLLLCLGFTDASLAAPTGKVDAVLAGLAQSTYLAEGRGRHAVYVFFDANCPSCHQLYMSLRGLLESQDIQLRWVPVAVVNPSSLGKAAAILEASDPLAALRRNAEAYDTGTYSGGIAEEIPSPDVERRVRANERLLNALEIPVVPSMLFQGKNGRAILIQGALSPIALHKVFRHLP